MSPILRIVICIIIAVLAVIPFFIKSETAQKVASIEIGVIGVLVTVFTAGSGQNTTTVNAQQVNIYQNGEIEVNTPLDNERTFIELQNRNLDKEIENDRWYGTVVAEEGDTIRFKVIYTNKSKQTQNDVLVFVKWSSGLEYVPGSTILYNSNHKDGVKLESDGLGDGSGINIGNSLAGASAVVTYEARVKPGLGIGTNVLRNWTQIYVNDLTPELGKDFVQDYADIMVLKEK